MINDYRRNSFDAISIPSYESLQKESEDSKSQDEIQITSQMVFNLKCEEKEGSRRSSPYTPMNTSTSSLCDAETCLKYINVEQPSHPNVNINDLNCHITQVTSPQLMIVFGEGDIDSALYFLIDSLHWPFTSNAVVTVLVEKKIRDEFVQRIRAQMRPLSIRVSKHPIYRATLAVLQELNMDVIVADKAQVPPPLTSPIIASECLQSKLSDGPGGVLCLHTFESTSEAIELCGKETLRFASISIWNESIESLYQLAASIDCNTFFFNCNNVSLVPIEESFAKKQVHVCIYNNFHYETLMVKDKVTIIVFPIGAHLAQIPLREGTISIPPVLLLNE